MSDDDLPRRWQCEDCYETTVDADHLVAPHPFDPDDKLSFCPHCKSVEPFHLICQAEGCTSRASAGIPNWRGHRYAWVCHKHTGDAN